MKYRMAAALLSLAGLFISLYLYLFKIGLIGSLACGSGGCETVQLSPYSKFLGLDVALYGVVGYVVLLITSLVALQRPVADRRISGLLALLSGVGVGFTIYLTYLELGVIHAICRWCVGSAVTITLLFVASLLDWRQGADAPSFAGSAASR
jgi:uncharacterized membrane protein